MTNNQMREAILRVVTASVSEFLRNQTAYSPTVTSAAMPYGEAIELEVPKTYSDPERWQIEIRVAVRSGPRR